MKKSFLKTHTLVFLSLVVALSVSLAILTETMQNVSAQTSSSANSLPTIVPPAQVNIFTRTLMLGSSGTDVLTLQKILNYDSATQVASYGSGSPGNESSYFATLTRLAVIRFQQKYGVDTITTTNGYVTGTGSVGLATQLKLSLIYTNKTSDTITSSVPALSLLPATTTGKPQITSISPSDIQDGDSITIKGNNFTATNTVNATFNNFKNASSTDGHTIKLNVKSILEDLFAKEFKDVPDNTNEEKQAKKELEKAALLAMNNNLLKNGLKGIPFKVSVENQNGKSEQVTIYYKLSPLP